MTALWLLARAWIGGIVGRIPWQAWVITGGLIAALAWHEYAVWRARHDAISEIQHQIDTAGGLVHDEAACARVARDTARGVQPSPADRQDCRNP